MPPTLESFTRAPDGLKRDVYDTLVSKTDCFSSTLGSEMTLIKEELKSSVTKLQATVDAHKSTIKDLKRSPTTCSDDLATLIDTANVIKGKVKTLKAKRNDLEGRSRSNNLRLVDLPEGLEDSESLFQRSYRTFYIWMKHPFSTAPTGHSEISSTRETHQSSLLPCERTNPASSSFPLLLGEKLSVFPDFFPSLAKKRAEFGNAKCLLHICPGVRFGFCYPAEPRITITSAAMHKFTGPALTTDFINRDLRRATSSD